MYYNYWIKLIILVVIFCFNFLITVPAYASALKPDTAWKIKTVTLPNGLPPYCSMRNHYSKANVSLILAQDMEDNVSLAIDFSEPILEQGKKYALDINIPEKLQQVFTSNAVNTHIIVSQIGQDKKFINSIGRGQELHIKMDGVNLQFKLFGTSKGLKLLSKCVANLNSGISIKTVSKIKPQNTFIRVDKPHKEAAYVPDAPTVTAIQTPKEPPIKTKTPELETMLKSALNITEIDVSHKDKGVYSWKKNNLYGNAQVFAWDKGKSFSDIIKIYIQKTNKRCPSNFASHTGQQLSLSGGHVYSNGNIACIGENTGNAAALFFYGMNNSFLVISHEGGVPQLSDALSIRNQISEHFLKLDAK